MDATQSVLVVISAIIVATTVNPYFIIPVAVMGIIFIYVRRVYLRTSTNVKRLEGKGFEIIAMNLFLFESN